MREFCDIPIREEAGAEGWLTIPDLEEDNFNDCRNLLRMKAYFPKQIHSCKVAVIKSQDDFPIPEADALVTFRPFLPIGVLTADCVPIIIYSPDVKAVAAIHAGWRGTLGGIVDNTLDLLEEHGASCSEMKVVFGPSIGVGCYEVDPDLVEKFADADFGDYVKYPRGVDRKPHLDLQGVNIERFRRRGVPISGIVRSSECTSGARNEKGKHLYPSYRRDKGTDLRFLTSVMLVGNE